MADIQKGELQDNLGNTIYPHTESDVVFCSDGQTVQEKLTKTENALGDASGKSGSLEVNDANILATTEATHKLSDSLQADNGQSFKFAYDSASGKYGYKAEVEGADTFFPFSEELVEQTVTVAQTKVPDDVLTFTFSNLSEVLGIKSSNISNISNAYFSFTRLNISGNTVNINVTGYTNARNFTLTAIGYAK